MEEHRLKAREWENFKKTWSQEDISNLERILKKVKMDENHIPDFKDPLTEQEKSWAANFAVQAYLWGCCRISS